MMFPVIHFISREPVPVRVDAPTWMPWTGALMILLPRIWSAGQSFAPSTWMTAVTAELVTAVASNVPPMTAVPWWMTSFWAWSQLVASDAGATSFAPWSNRNVTPGGMVRAPHR